MGLSLQSLSITSAFNSIVSFFKSQENNSKWKDLTTGAEGVFLIRMLANILSNISYRLVAARRENYLSTANLLSSNIGIAVNLGYSVPRGSNQKRLVQFTPSGNYTISKFSRIGTYSPDYDIINTENITLVNGVSQEIKTVIGKLKEVTFTAGTSAVKLFTLYTESISEDFLLYNDSILVPTSSSIRDLKDDYYLVRTNPYNSVDILYLNNSTTGQYKYGSETEFTLKYIELANVETVDYTTDMFTYGTFISTISIDEYVPFEEVEDIKINAPYYHEKQNLIRSKSDYSQEVKQSIPNIKETSYTPITPTYTLVTYLKDDYTTIKLSEKIILNNILVEENYFGTPLPDITFSEREIIDLDITLNLLDKYTDVSDIDIDINNLLKNNYTIALNQSFDTYTLERLLENNLSYVKYARVEYKKNIRANTTRYQLGTIITDNGYYYKAKSVLGTSGASEPVWNLPIEIIATIDTELETTDNNIIWRAYKKLNIDNMSEWKVSNKYHIGDYVYSSNYPNYMFKCVDLIKSSGTSVPDISSTDVGDFIADGNIIWVCKTYNDTYSDRTDSTNYRLSDSVNIGTLSFECVGYIGVSGAATPNFEQTSYTINSFTSTGFNILGDKTAYFKQNDVIKAVSSNNTYTFSVKSSSYNQSTQITTVIVNQSVSLDYEYSTLIPTLRGTQDGEILWELVDDITNIVYSWNVYNTFSYTLATI